MEEKIIDNIENIETTKENHNHVVSKKKNYACYLNRNCYRNSCFIFLLTLKH